MQTNKANKHIIVRSINIVGSERTGTHGVATGVVRHCRDRNQQAIRIDLYHGVNQRDVDIMLTAGGNDINRQKINNVIARLNERIKCTSQLVDSYYDHLPVNPNDDPMHSEALNEVAKTLFEIQRDDIMGTLNEISHCFPKWKNRMNLVVVITRGYMDFLIHEDITYDEVQERYTNQNSDLEKFFKLQTKTFEKSKRFLETIVVVTREHKTVLDKNLVVRYSDDKYNWFVDSYFNDPKMLPYTSNVTPRDVSVVRYNTTKFNRSTEIADEARLRRWLPNISDNVLMHFNLSL